MVCHPDTDEYFHKIKMATYSLKIEQCAADLSGSAMLQEYQHSSFLVHHYYCFTMKEKQNILNIMNVERLNLDL